MACAINFSPRTMLIYAQRCCKISQNPKFRYFSTSLVDRRRSLSKKNTKCFQLNAEEARIEHLLDEFDRKLARMHSDFPDPFENVHQRRLIILSIQKRIIEMEAVIRADSLLPIPESTLLVLKKLHKLSARCWQTERKWKQILQKTDNPRVEQLIALINAGNLQQESFCEAMGRFFSMAPSVNCEVPPLTEFTPKEIKGALCFNFPMILKLNFMVQCVTHVLMKPL